MALKIQIYSDVICPWCFLGKRRLDQALKSMERSPEVEIEYLPYELNPSTPEEGVDRHKYLQAKYGASIEAAHNRLEKLGKEVDIEYNFGKAAKIPNTLKAHRVIWLAGKEGLEKEVVDALFAAYFTEGKDLGDKKTLVDIAASAGLDRAKVEKLLKSQEGTEEVRAMEEKAYNHGVSGVPHFIFGEKGEISGAQPTEVFVSILAQLKG